MLTGMAHDPAQYVGVRACVHACVSERACVWVCAGVCVCARVSLACPPVREEGCYETEGAREGVAVVDGRPGGIRGSGLRDQLGDRPVPAQRHMPHAARYAYAYSVLRGHVASGDPMLNVASL